MFQKYFNNKYDIQKLKFKKIFIIYIIDLKIQENKSYQNNL